jgi:hypothetical protein
VLGWGWRVERRRRDVGTSGCGEEEGKGCRTMNKVQMLYTCMNKNMIPVETSPEMGVVEIKENCGEGELKYYIFDIL